jgi:hypothetical protein
VPEDTSSNVKTGSNPQHTAAFGSNNVPGWHTGKKTGATSMIGRVASTVGKTLNQAVESPTRFVSGELSNQAQVLIPAGAGNNHTKALNSCTVKST